MAFLVGGANSSAVTAYDIDNSLRFNGGDAAHLTRTPSSASNRKTWTYSVWVKIGEISATDNWLFQSNKSSLTSWISIEGDKIIVYMSSGARLQSTALLRDPSAWYHIVLAVDTTQSTGSNRIKLYVNGSQITDFTTHETYGSEDDEFGFNNNTEHEIGSGAGDAGRYWKGYMAEVHFIDGTALTPSSFGETDSDSGIWKPKSASVTFGTNGFYLEFKGTGTSQDSSGIGADTSGEDNHWAVSNLAATDQTTDTPTNNFATWNPLVPITNTQSEGNLKTSTAVGNAIPSTIGVSSGKWYAEVFFVSGTHCRIGITNLAGVGELHGFAAGNSWIKVNGSSFYHDSTQISSQGQAITSDDIVMIAVDIDAGKIWWGKNGTWDDNASGTGVPATGAYPTYTGDTGISNGGEIFFAVASGSGTLVFEANFGNPSFAISSGNADANDYGNFEYAVPSGFYALCTKNLAEFG